MDIENRVDTLKKHQLRCLKPRLFNGDKLADQINYICCNERKNQINLKSDKEIKKSIIKKKTYSLIVNLIH